MVISMLNMMRIDKGLGIKKIIVGGWLAKDWETTGLDSFRLKSVNPEFFIELNSLKLVGTNGENVIGKRATSIIMLYESGVWKLIMSCRLP